MTSRDRRRPSPTTGRVVPAFLPSQPAQAALRRLLDGDADLSALADVLRLDRSTLHRLLCRDRLRYDAADHIAVALGRHPYELWPEWFTESPEQQSDGRP